MPIGRLPRTLALLLLALALATSASLSAGPAPSSESSESEYTRDADLAALVEWVDLEQSFTAERRRQALQTIADLRQEKVEFTDASFYMELRRIVGLAENGHTAVTGQPVYDSFGLVPLRAYWFSDGLYVVRVRNDHANLLGARIETIAGRPIAEIEKLLLPYHGGTTAHFRRYVAPGLMLCPPLLHAIGISPSEETLALGGIDAGGAAFDVRLTVDGAGTIGRGFPWHNLHPQPFRGEQDWVRVHDEVAELPLYLQQRDELFRYLLLEDGAIAYVQLRSNFGSGGESVSKFAGRVRKWLARDRPRSIILDNRQNPGGDLTRTAEFALDLPSLAASEGKVYVITDSATFSAGIYTSFYPKAADPERSVIVGEHVGDAPRFWAETGTPFRLPDSGYPIGYALQLHDIAEGCRTDVCHMARHRSRWNLAVGSLEPDWPVPMSYADFKAARDPALERILETEAESARRAPLAN